MNLPGHFLRRRLAVVALLSLCGMILSSESVHAGNQALRLDGQGSYIELPPNVFTNLSQATVEVWVKWSQLRSYSRVFEYGQPGQSLSLFEHAASADLRFNIYPLNQPRYTIQVPDVIRTNEWIHLAAVSGPGGMHLYVNGQHVGEQATTASFSSVGSGRSLIGTGMGSASDQDFAGEIDELRIWNYPRTAAEIQQDMFKRLAGTEPGMLHLWNFDEGSAKDATGLAADGTLYGNATIVPASLGLVEKQTPPVVPVAAATSTIAPAVVHTAPEEHTATSLAVWWIAGSLTALALVLAWLAFMFRRSGLGAERIVMTHPQSIAAPAVQSSKLPLESDQKQLKQRALEDLTDFAKESLVQGLFTQRAALLEANKKAQAELVALEERLASLGLAERIHAYEERIDALERQLADRGSEVKELTTATLRLLRSRLEDERRKVAPPSQFN